MEENAFLEKCGSFFGDLFFEELLGDVDVCDLVVRIFEYVYFYHLAGLGEHLAALGAEVAEVKFLTDLLIAFGEYVDRFQS